MCIKQPSDMGVSLLVAQLPADHSCVLVRPAVIADCPPLAVDENLHAPFFLILSIHQSDRKTYVRIQNHGEGQTSQRGHSMRDFMECNFLKVTYKIS